MSSTPKWYCCKKTQSPHTFDELTLLGQFLRCITKRLVVDVKVNVFGEHENVLEECSRVIDLYWRLKDRSRNEEFQALSKKIKKSPYNALLIRKLDIIVSRNECHFNQLTFVLRKTMDDLLRKSMQSEVWLNWALQIAQLYNKCSILDKRNDDNLTSTTDGNSSVCSNTFPVLLLSVKPMVDFAHVLQLVSQTRVEQNSLDLLFGLVNLGEQITWQTGAAKVDTDYTNVAETSNCSSLEILRILTLNLHCDGEFQQLYESQTRELISCRQFDHIQDGEVGMQSAIIVQAARRGVRRQHTEQFLQRERSFLSQLIAKAIDLSPSIFDDSSRVDVSAFIVRGMRLIWSYVSIILDHIILWWIDMPISSYSVTHVDSIRNWLHMQSDDDIPEPVFSTLQGIAEILTNFVCNNVWDQLFRLTLISARCSSHIVDCFIAQYRNEPKTALGTSTGSVWIALFTHLFNLSNNYFPREQSELGVLPVAEQIPILHRIDHSVHSMRLWVTEEAKRLSGDWHMNTFFQLLDYDVRRSLELFTTLRLPKLNLEYTDVLMLVCVALRTKLICEVNANMDKLRKTTDECVHILSNVCRILSLAHFKLVFPPVSHWQQNVYTKTEEGRGSYVEHVLNQMMLPAIKATNDISILKLILKIICEAWLDYIYIRRIKFSAQGALQLLDDFDSATDWILNCSLLDEGHVEQLSQHEVLRTCKGVGKILLRKPEDIISIQHSPKYEKRQVSDGSGQETQLPSEMFVSNQKHWLELRARNSRFPLFGICCGNNCP